MAILYKCTWRGCSKIIEVQGYCTIHKCKADKVKQESDNKRHTTYSINRLMDKEQKKYQAFYSSKAWKQCRDSVIANCYGIDIVEYYKTGNISQGYTVHHIECIEDNYDIRLDTNNLIYLNQSNHIRVHKEYAKGTKEKRIIQELLLDLKIKFIEEFS